MRKKARDEWIISKRSVVHVRRCSPVRYSCLQMDVSMIRSIRVDERKIKKRKMGEEKKEAAVAYFTIPGSSIVLSERRKEHDTRPGNGDIDNHREEYETTLESPTTAPLAKCHDATIARIKSRLSLLKSIGMHALVWYWYLIRFTCSRSHTPHAATRAAVYRPSNRKSRQSSRSFLNPSSRPRWH